MAVAAALAAALASSSTAAKITIKQKLVGDDEEP